MGPSDWIQVAAILVSGWIGIVALRHSRATSARLQKFEDLAHRQRHIDQQRARVRAEFRRTPAETGREQWKLYIVNDGPGHARDIRVAVDHDWVRLKEEKLDEIGVLGPLAYMSAPVRGVGLAPAHFKIKWTDDAGEPGSWESDVS